MLNISPTLLKMAYTTQKHISWNKKYNNVKKKAVFALGSHENIYIYTLPLVNLDNISENQEK